MADGQDAGTPDEPVGAQDTPGSPSGLTCPQCGGVMWQQSSETFSCRIGHRLSFEELMIQQYTSRQSALWWAVRSLEERAAIERHLATRHKRSGHPELATVVGRRA